MKKFHSGMCKPKVVLEALKERPTSKRIVQGFDIKAQQVNLRILAFLRDAFYCIR